MMTDDIDWCNDATFLHFASEMNWMEAADIDEPSMMTTKICNWILKKNQWFIVIDSKLFSFLIPHSKNTNF